MKARKMKLAALGLAAAMIMGLAAPAMADELSDGFGQEDVINTESSYEGLDLGGACGNAPAAPEVNENTAPAAPANNESAQHCYSAAGFREYSRRQCEMPVGTWECIDMELFTEDETE